MCMAGMTDPAAPTGADAADVPRNPFAGQYAELHCHSAFSLLDGASLPAQLVSQAAAFSTWIMLIVGGALLAMRLILGRVSRRLGYLGQS